MREWMASAPETNKRSDLFIGTKIGPGGGCWPLGYNESIAQAKMIIGYYNQLPSQLPTANITQVDLLMVHWPINCGPCAVPVRRGTMCARCFCAPQSANPAGCSAPPPTPGHGGRTLPEHDTNDRPSL